MGDSLNLLASLDMKESVLIIIIILYKKIGNNIGRFITLF